MAAPTPGTQVIALFDFKGASKEVYVNITINFHLHINTNGFPSPISFNKYLHIFRLTFLSSG